MERKHLSLHILQYATQLGKLCLSFNVFNETTVSTRTVVFESLSGCLTHFAANVAPLPYAHIRKNREPREREVKEQLRGVSSEPVLQACSRFHRLKILAS